MASGKPPVSEEPREQNDTVGNESGDRASVRAPSGDEEREHDKDIQADKEGEGVKEPSGHGRKHGNELEREADAPGLEPGPAAQQGGQSRPADCLFSARGR